MLFTETPNMSFIQWVPDPNDGNTLVCVGYCVLFAYGACLCKIAADGSYPVAANQVNQLLLQHQQGVPPGAPLFATAMAAMPPQHQQGGSGQQPPGANGGKAPRGGGSNAGKRGGRGGGGGNGGRSRLQQGNQGNGSK